MDRPEPVTQESKFQEKSESACIIQRFSNCICCTETTGENLNTLQRLLEQSIHSSLLTLKLKSAFTNPPWVSSATRQCLKSSKRSEYPGLARLRLIKEASATKIKIS
jgi:hypothetical protein